MDPNVPLAHAGQSLEAHLTDVAALARTFAQAFGLPAAGELIGGSHDEGKIRKAFQNYLRSGIGILHPGDAGFVDAKRLKGKIDHATAGAQRLWRAVLRTRGMRGGDALCAQMLALCICSHHTGLMDCLTPDGEPRFDERMQDTERTHFQEVRDAFGSDFGAPGGRLLSRALAEMRGRVAPMLRVPASPLCPRNCTIRCCTRNPLAWFSLGLLTRMLLSCLVDADDTDTADVKRPENAALRSAGPPPWPELIERLEKKLSTFEERHPIDAVRKRISEQCLDRAADPKGIFTLTVPTGCGKTLASLRFALHHAAHHGMMRIINVIPFTSIIDQNAQVARDILEKGREFGSIVLEHHSNLTPEEETPRTKLLAENWDAPVIYTTMVQFLESVFRGGTRATRRMHRLADAVIVFDEIQRLPVNCVYLFCNAVNFLVRECGASVVLCTATQPLLNGPPNPEMGALPFGAKEELAQIDADVLQRLKRVEILDETRPEGWSVAEIADLAIAELRRTGSCLVVVNTKAWARKVYDECAKRGVPGIRYLTTELCAAHRLRVLDAMRADLATGNGGGRPPVLCISTQLIEAGVDISFGAVVRFLAGFDSIIQAAGRCNRNGESGDPGRVHVVNPAGEDLSRLTEIKVGRENSRRILQEFRADPAGLGGSLLHPRVMERYFTYAFHDRAGEMAYPVPRTGAAGRDDTLLKMLSCNPLNGGDVGTYSPLRQSFRTAGKLFQVIDAPTCGVIVPYEKGKELIAQLCAVSDPVKEKDILRTAQRYSVNVFPNVWRQLEAAQAIYETQKGTGIFYLDLQYYSDRFGLSTTIVNAMDMLICDGGVREK